MGTVWGVSVGPLVVGNMGSSQYRLYLAVKDRDVPSATTYATTLDDMRVQLTRNGDAHWHSACVADTDRRARYILLGELCSCPSPETLWGSDSRSLMVVVPRKEHKAEEQDAKGQCTQWQWLELDEKAIVKFASFYREQYTAPRSSSTDEHLLFQATLVVLRLLACT